MNLRMQFGLRGFLLTVLAIACCIGIGIQFGSYAAMAALYICILFLVLFAKTINGWVKVVAILTLSFGMLVLAAPTHSHHEFRSRQSAIKQIATALAQYEADYGRLPPPTVNDKHGRPLHSWRVLILPYLGHGELYSQYRFNEPWNGPHNRQLSELIPPVYQYRNERTITGRTAYVALLGKESPWALGASSTPEYLMPAMAVIEVGSLNINWMEPRDLDVDALSSTGLISEINKPGTHGLFATSTDGFVLVYLDDESIGNLKARSRVPK